MSTVKFTRHLIISFLFFMSINVSYAAMPKIMVVLDASGSMWGKIQGKAKIDIARQVLKGFLKDLDPKTQIGLIAYGHRRKGDCKDIETLIPVGKLNASNMTRIVQGISPKGKTPISQAVLQAAEALKYTEEKSAVILISDGKETCNMDPCKLGTMLAKKGVNFKAYVIGFDVKKADQAGLICLAKNTGGAFYEAKNAGDLKKALQKTAQVVKVSKTLTAKPKKKVQAYKPGLYLKAVLKEGGKPIRQGLQWWINESQPNLEGQHKNVSYSSSNKPFIKLIPGQYQIVVRYGDVSVTDIATVKVNTHNVHTVILNAGHLKLGAKASETGEVITKGLRYWIDSDKMDIQGSRKNISYSSSSRPIFNLAEGKYLVRIKYGDAIANQFVEVKKGEITNIVININAGTLRLTGVMQQGGKQIHTGIRWWIKSAKTALDGSRKDVSYSSSHKPIFFLNAGKYFVLSKFGQAATTKTIEIKANELTDEIFNLNAGYAKLLATATADGDVLKRGVRWWITGAKADMYGKYKNVDYSSNPNPIFTLTDGTYRVVTRYGTATTITQLKVNAGNIVQKSVNMNAGVVKLQAILPGSDKVLTSVRWWINETKSDLNGNHKNVTYSSSNTPIFTLGAGTYQVVVKYGDISSTSTFTVTAGESKTIKVRIKK